MSDEKGKKPKESAQQSQSQSRGDALDAQYGGIGISAVSAAALALKGPRVKAPSEEWK